MKSIFIVLLCVLLCEMTGAEISLNSTLIRGKYALPNQEVIFTCTSVNATILNWNSTDFIGVNNIFPISSVGPARNRTRGTTVATRVDTFVEGGNTVIVSQLRIIASEQFPSSAVTCRVNGEGPSETIHFITTENALQEVSLNSTLIYGMYALPNQEVIFTCTSVNATILNWNSTDFIGVNNIFPISSVGPARNRTRGTTVATRLNTFIEGGNTVIISQLRIIASEQFSSSAVTCRVNGDGPSETIHFITTEFARTTTSIAETMEIPTDGNNDSFITESTQKRAACSGGCGLGIGIGVVCVVFIGVVAIFIIVLVIVKKRTCMREGMKVCSIELAPDPQKDEHEEGDDIKQPENEVNSITVTADQKPPVTPVKETNEEPDDVESPEKSEKKPLLEQQPENEVNSISVAASEKPPVTPVKETNEEPDDVEPPEKSEKEPLQEVLICVGIGNKGLVVRRRDNISVGHAYSTSLPSIDTCTKDEHNICIGSSSLPQLNVDDSTSQIPLDSDTKKQDDEDHSATTSGDSGVDDESSSASEYEMDSQAIEQVGEAHSEDSGVDDSSNGMECEMESKLKKCEQVGEVPEPNIEEETAQNPDSNEKSNRGGGVTEPEDKVDGKVNLQHTLCESPYGDLVSFERQDSDYCELGDIIDKLCKHMKKMICELRSEFDIIVNRGIWQSPMQAVGVAVCVPTASVRKEIKFLQEMPINGQLRRPNIVKLITTGEPIVHSKVDSLSTFLKQWQPDDPKFYHQIVSTLEYVLSKPSFVHRNMYLAPGNAWDHMSKILSNLAKSRMEENYYNSGRKIPVMWTAPEPIVAPCTFYGQVHENSDFMFMRWSPAPLFGFGLAKQKQRKLSNMHYVMQSLMSYWRDDILMGHEHILEYILDYFYLIDMQALTKKSNKCSCDKDGVNRGFPGKQREPGAKGNAGSFGRSGHPRKAERPNTGSRNLRQRKKGCASDLNYVCRDQDKVKHPRPAGCKNIKLE